MTGLRFSAIHVIRVLVLMAVLLPTAVGAQTNVLAGRVLGPDGEPVADQTVVLHRVAGGAGATVAQAVSDASGNFALRFDAPDIDGDAAYFVAARWQGELYLGPPFRTPVDSAADYTMQVGVPGTSASVLLGSGQASNGPAPQPAATSDPFPYRTWLLLIIPLLVMALATGYFLTRGRGADRRRRMLLEIAQLDDTFESELVNGDIANSRLYWAERRALLERLARES